jgi:histone acetyltransferase (RNA polymerase elongator complex component)
MKAQKRHVNIPIFIPHLGCPNMCVFCNQRLISGKNSFDISSVNNEIDTALATIPAGTETEIAFFGGSFTGIDRGLMVSLLDIAKGYADARKIGSIRLSTRPDYINKEILEILKKYPVRTIELGIQSMDDKVLAASKRGHTAVQSETACRLIRQYGFEFIGQMMVGLPLADTESEIETAGAICALGAAGARVYPAVVFRGTELEAMSKAGLYTPLDTETAVIRTKNVLAVFAEHDIPVIRVGLCSSDNLASDEEVAGGASHAAIGELAMGELYYDILCRKFDVKDLNGTSITVFVPAGEISKVVGQHRRNTERLRKKYGIQNITFREDASLARYEIRINDHRDQED